MESVGTERIPSLVERTRRLAEEIDALAFGEPVAFVYNPLRYARAPHEIYLQRFGRTRKRVVFWGMNPGPWGMAQTGVPFGEVTAVRDWMQIYADVGSPRTPHPSRPVKGFGTNRSEVSGRRLWGLVRERFGTPDAFFSDQLIMNYCPLLFLAGDAKNITPDKLNARDRERLYSICDAYVADVVQMLSPSYLVGIGKFAASRMEAVVSSLTTGAGAEGAPGAASHPATSGFPGSRRASRSPVGTIRVASILHPSPASPAANRGWDRIVTEQLTHEGIW